MNIYFKPINVKSDEDLSYTYKLLQERYKKKYAAVSKNYCPTFSDHKKNLSKLFTDYSIIYLNEIRLGIIALLKDGSITHNYDFKSIKENIKKIKRVSYELGYNILKKYFEHKKLKYAHVKINPNNNLSLYGFLNMFKKFNSELKLDTIKINLKYE